LIVTLSLTHCFSSFFFSLYIYTYAYTYSIIYFLVLTKPIPAWFPVKVSFSTSDTIVTIYTYRSTNRFVSLQDLVLSVRKIDEIDKSISSIQASKSQKRDFRDFSGAKVCYSNRNVKSENFMHSEWREEKFLKGIVGDKMRLRFWNKHQKMHLVFMQLARYNWMHITVLRYQQSIPENLANK